MDKLYSERFLNAFSAIEKHLRRVSGRSRFERFYLLIEKAASKNGAVGFFKDDLREYADLRNAIVHERRDGKPIAEPHPETVAAIEEIKEKILTPPPLIPAFSVQVDICGPKDRIGLAAKKMLDGNFSQLPVYHNQTLLGLLTAETIARWLASRLAPRYSKFEEESVEVCLGYTEDPDNYVLLARDNTVFQAIAAFEDYSHRGKYLDAIIITRNGKRTEAPLGIITTFDIPKMLAVVGHKQGM